MNTNPENHADTDLDTEALAALSGTFAGQSMTTSLDSVVAAGRRTRNRHRGVAAGLGASAAALVAAIGVLAPSSGGAAGPHVASNTGRQQNAVTQHSGVDIENASFAVHTNADHTVSISVKQIFDPTALREALGEAGIPADVQTPGAPPSTDRPYRCELTPGVKQLDGKDVFVMGKPGDHLTLKDAATLFTVDPAKLPAGAVVSLWVYDVRSSATGKLDHVTGIQLLSGMPGKCVWTVTAGEK